MVELKNVTKLYRSNTTIVGALNGINLTFRDNEFVAILGPSGCGKTTTLNILGGLDRYTDGDLVINGVSTNNYTDRDWDNYRNRRVGFVFQSYNLISHQTALANVEIAMTLSGIGKGERRRRAKEALERVGLGDQLKKKPNQMSGGQTQRVAIARALVNNPEILMADEPTGALDSETSVMVMDILKEIAKDRLVIMVTHNSDLAERYATRIVKLLDGKIVDDSDPVTNAEKAAAAALNSAEPKRERKPAIGFFTALGLSLTNLMTKKGRTFLTAFAGSIGIIGIALILSLSNGFQAYIDDVQSDTLSTYPISITEQTADIGSVMSTLADSQSEAQGREKDTGKIYSLDIMNSMAKSISAMMGAQNDLVSFRGYLIDHYDEIKDSLNAVGYNYAVQLNIFKGDPGSAKQVYPAYFLKSILGVAPGEVGGTTSFNDEEVAFDTSMSGMPMMSSGTEIWTEMMDNPELLRSQYDVIAGTWPDNYDEIVIVVSESDAIRDYSLYGMGLKDPSELDGFYNAVLSGEVVESESMEFTYDELLNLTYRVLPNAAFYAKEGDVWLDKSNDESYVQGTLNNALTLKVSAIIRPASGTSATAITGSIGYLPSLTKEMMARTFDSAIVREQMTNPEIDVFTGKPFGEIDAAQNEADMAEMMANLTPEQQQMLANMTEEQIAALSAQYAPTSSATFESNKTKLGIVDEAHPTAINLYPKDFESKDKLSDFIEVYNNRLLEADPDAQTLKYTDFMGLLLSSVTTVVNGISYVLIAFVSISLVVSSIMIGIITYVSVLERTKEIGILKALGASKRDVGQVFNAETLIVGLFSGTFGILVSVLLCVPANIIIQNLTQIPNVATLPVLNGIILIALSCALTLIAGLIPARLASRKDPVVALRTE
ncbi:MAG: ABC transporter ATP-binding protein/permease [Oscillospiraceae bacterium]|jgi:putative ABC transport system permease protein|nr:ABC transporter ATP-binding protein/permease [Oscillospiraceae bacterium]